MNLDAIPNALLAVTDKVFHYKAYGTTDKYIVWAEDNQADAIWADGEMQSQAIEGTIDYYTKSENDPNVGLIQNALNGVCSWRLNSIQFEDESKLIHYEWTWEIWHE